MSNIQQARYDNYINSLKSQAVSSYTEMHHILPRSLGGDDSPDNLIRLTARQHFIAHWMLWKIHRNESMTRAFFAMCKLKKKKQHRYTKINSKTFALLRADRSRLIIKANKERWQDPVWAEKQRQKLSAAANTEKEKQRRRENAIKMNAANKDINSARQSALWQDETWAEQTIAKCRERCRARRRIIIIDGAEYVGGEEVANKFGISKSEVRRRIASQTERFAGWSYKQPTM